MYDKKSLKAEEFINHEEILKTLDYAEKNKDNLDLINKLLEKARPVKTGNETCDLLTLVNGKVVKTDPMSLKDAYDRYGKGPVPDNFRIAFDMNQSVENSMGSTSKEDAKRMYGAQVANNFFAQA